MIPLSVTLRGFHGFRAGLGLDEVSLDLSGLPPGLVAVTGQNGAGKTTLLDNLQPFRIQPFKCRKSPDWSVGSFSYYDQCYGDNAMKELVFEMDGVRYKAVVLIDAVKRKQEAYLYQQTRPHDNWMPLNDGKVKTYDEAVEKIMGTPSMFFSSVFRAQSARVLSDYRRSEIVSILSELLNVGHIRAQADKCRAVVAALSGELDLVRARLADIEGEAAVITDLQHGICEHDSLIAEAHMRLDFTRKELESVRVDISAIKERRAAADSERARLRSLQDQLAAERVRLVDTEAALKKSDADFDNRIAALKASHSRFVADLEAKVARAEKIVSGGEQVRQAVVNEVNLVAHVETLNAEMDRLRSERDALKDASGVYAAQLRGVETDIKNAEAAVSRLDGLDCRGDASGWLNPDCKLISAAVAYRDALPGYREVAADLDRRVAEDAVALEAYSSQIASAIDACDVAGKSLDECRRFTRLLPELELAEANLAEWKQSLESRSKEVEIEVKQLEGDKWYEGSGFDLAMSKLRDAMRDLESQIAAFPVAADETEALRAAIMRETDLLGSINKHEDVVLHGERTVSGLKARLGVLLEKSDVADGLRGKEEVLSRKIANFSLLQKACSNDGIIALELDDASPAIAALVNDLLFACYGSRFSVRMETQAEKVDGSMKETFDIIVIDSETGDERSITECSGGQTSWLNDAITRGICLFNADRSGKRFESIFVDESDGALDAGKKMEFFAIKRKALELGAHTREFFISQSEELVSMSDARIVLERGRVYVA